MPHTRALSVSPLLQSEQVTFKFSPGAINRCLSSSKSLTPHVIKHRRSFTSCGKSRRNKTADISPIEFDLKIFSPVAPKNTPCKQRISSTNINKPTSKTHKISSGPSIVVHNENNDIIHQEKSPKIDILDHHLTVDTILEDIGMRKYSIIFLNEEIDLEVFFTMTNQDLCQIGITSRRDRHLILDAINLFVDNVYK